MENSEDSFNFRSHHHMSNDLAIP